MEEFIDLEFWRGSVSLLGLNKWTSDQERS